MQKDTVRKVQLHQDWTFVCFVEDRDGGTDGLTRFTYVSEYSGVGKNDHFNDNLYLMRMNVSCFKERSDSYQEILGKVSNLLEEFRASEIVYAKLIRKSKVAKVHPLLKGVTITALAV